MKRAVASLREGPADRSKRKTFWDLEDQTGNILP